jgi:hypothetical protein
MGMGGLNHIPFRVSDCSQFKLIQPAAQFLLNLALMSFDELIKV